VQLLKANFAVFLETSVNLRATDWSHLVRSRPLSQCLSQTKCHTPENSSYFLQLHVSAYRPSESDLYYETNEKRTTGCGQRVEEDGGRTGGRGWPCPLQMPAPGTQQPVGYGREMTTAVLQSGHCGRGPPGVLKSVQRLCLTGKVQGRLYYKHGNDGRTGGGGSGTQWGHGVLCFGARTLKYWKVQGASRMYAICKVRGLPRRRRVLDLKAVSVRNAVGGPEIGPATISPGQTFRTRAEMT